MPNSKPQKEKCHVIWKRPDGFHNAHPEDFKVTLLSNDLKIWLHRTDKVNFPFRIAGGWQAEGATAKLNTLVNLLGDDEAVWEATLVKIFDNTMGDNLVGHIEGLTKWLSELKPHLKGDTWEVEIMNQALLDVTKSLQKIKSRLAKNAPS